MLFKAIAARVVFFGAVIGITAAPPAALAEEGRPVADISFPGSGMSSGPLNLIDQGDIVVTMMRDAALDPGAIKAIEDFQGFITENRGLFERPISELSNEERVQLLAGYQNALMGMEAIKPLAEILSSREWLTSADPALAARLKERCGRDFVSGRDVVKEFGELLANPISFDGDTVNIVEDFTGIQRECAEAAADIAALAAQESARLAAYIESEERLLEQAIADGDQEAIDRHRANLEQARQDKEEVDRDFDLAQALKFLSGLGQAVAGVVGIVASGGSCVPCYLAVANGVYEGYTAIDAMTGADTVLVNTPASRPDIDPDVEVTPDEFQEAIENVRIDPQYQVIEPRTPGGNFIVTRETGTTLLVIHQIKPDPFIIELDLTNVTPGAGTNLGLLPLNRLTDVVWTQVEDTKGIQRTSVNLILIGDLDGVEVKVSFNENPVGGRIVVTATAN